MIFQVQARCLETCVFSLFGDVRLQILQSDVKRQVKMWVSGAWILTIKITFSEEGSKNRIFLRVKKRHKKRCLKTLSRGKFFTPKNHEISRCCRRHVWKTWRRASPDSLVAPPQKGLLQHRNWLNKGHLKFTCFFDLFFQENEKMGSSGRLQQYFCDPRWIQRPYAWHLVFKFKAVFWEHFPFTLTVVQT